MYTLPPALFERGASFSTVRLAASPGRRGYFLKYYYCYYAN